MLKQMHSYKIHTLVLSLAALTVLMTGCGNKTEEEYSEEPVEVRYEWGLPIDSFRIDTCTVKDGETLGGILNRMGASRKIQSQVITLNPKDFDYRSIKSGRTYYGFYQKDSTGAEYLHHWVYVATICDAVVLHTHDSLYVERHTKPVEVRERQAEATIQSSLWNAMTGNNLPVELALELSEIYAWTIDFFGLQKGDSIRVFYDEKYVDTTRIGIGRIYAANFYHGSKWQEAYWFDSNDTTMVKNAKGGRTVGYFDADGKSLKKAFLKAPLNYKRISSRFTYARKHPIYKVVRPHTGVDYAAPAGTPVVSIGDGTVIFKAYKGGGGNTVKIRHNSSYTTAYLHLQGYAKGLQVGQHVRQGEVIGYVGSTGSSTGPHLDFRVWKDGTPVDPLKMISPPSEPVGKNYQAEFDSLVNRMRPQITK